MEALRKNVIFCCARQVLVTDLVAAGMVGVLGAISGWTQAAQYGNGLIWMGAGIFILGLMIVGGNLVGTGNRRLPSDQPVGPVQTIHQMDEHHIEQYRYLSLMAISAGLAIGLGLLLM